jgi:hypothetical protein
VAPKASNATPLAISALRRQTPKVGAVCGNPARTVLCGGRAVMRGPYRDQLCAAPASDRTLFIIMRKIGGRMREPWSRTAYLPAVSRHVPEWLNYSPAHNAVLAESAPGAR